MKGCALLHSFRLQPEQRQTVTPRRLAGPAPCHSNGRIAVVVALNAPLDAERSRGRRLDDDGARLHHRALRLCEQHVCIRHREKAERDRVERPHDCGYPAMIDVIRMTAYTNRLWQRE